MNMRRLVVLNQVIVVFGSVAQLLASMRSERPTKRRVVEVLLGWSLPLNLGVLETFFFVQHLLRGGGLHEDVERSSGDQVRSEVAVAHLAFGVLGLLSVRLRGMFWFATVIGHTIFLVGVAAVNAREVLKNKVFLFDVLMSLAHVGLLKAYEPLEAARPRRARRRWFGTRS